MEGENSSHGHDPLPSQPLPPKAAVSVPPAAVGIADELNSLKAFLSLSGGCILYCLSAFAIIYGIAQNLGPMLAKSTSLSEAFGCFIALNMYELALLGVLIMIVVWRNVTDDAISLVVLVALFLIASGTILGTVADRAPQLSLAIAFAAVAIGLGKLYAMRRYISFKLENLAFYGMALVLLWNFLAAPIMSKLLLNAPAADAGRRFQWLVAWLPLLAGALLILVSAARSKSDDEHRNITQPFLHTSSMTWIFSLVLLGAAYAHQYAMAYMYVVDHAFGDYIPLIGVLSLLLMEFVRSLGKPNNDLQIAIAAAPLVLALYAILNKSVIAPFGFSPELLWYMPVTLGLIGIGVLWLNIRHTIYGLRCVVVAYAMGVLLTAGFSPRDLHTLHWHLAGTAIVAILLYFGITRKSIALCFLSVIAVDIGLSTMKHFESYVHALGLTPEGTFIGIIGIGTLLICLFFGKKAPQALVFFGAIATMVFLFDLTSEMAGLQISLTAVAVAITCILLWLRNRSVAAMVFLCIPILARFYILGKDMSHWRWIILSFILLFLGALTSLYKGKKMATPTTESEPHP